jgi:hypothetical protein
MEALESVETDIGLLEAIARQGPRAALLWAIAADDTALTGPEEVAGWGDLEDAPPETKAALFVDLLSTSDGSALHPNFREPVMWQVIEQRFGHLADAVEARIGTTEAMPDAC